MQYEATLKVVGATPQEAAQKLSQIAGAYSYTVSQPPLGSFDPNTRDDLRRSVNDVFQQWFEDLAVKNPDMPMEDVFELTMQQFYAHFGHVPHCKTYRAFATRRKLNIQRSPGRKQGKR